MLNLWYVMWFGGGWLFSVYQFFRYGLGVWLLYGCDYCTEFDLFVGQLMWSKGLGMVFIIWLLHVYSFGIVYVQK